MLRKLALVLSMVLGFALVASGPASASANDDKKEGKIQVCKVADVKKDDKDFKKENFYFVIRQKGKDGEKDRYRFDIRVTKEYPKDCKEFKVDTGAYVVRERDIPKGWKLADIDVKGSCYYRDRNDKDAKVEVDVKDKGKCTVTFTNKKKGHDK